MPPTPPTSIPRTITTVMSLPSSTRQSRYSGENSVKQTITEASQKCITAFCKKYHLTGEFKNPTLKPIFPNLGGASESLPHRLLRCLCFGKLTSTCFIQPSLTITQSCSETSFLVGVILPSLSVSRNLATTSLPKFRNSRAILHQAARRSAS